MVKMILAEMYFVSSSFLKTQMSYQFSGLWQYDNPKLNYIISTVSFSQVTCALRIEVARQLC